jgi:hypothetical protein
MKQFHGVPIYSTNRIFSAWEAWRRSEYIKLNSQEDPKASDTEKNKILEEIKIERAAAANVSHKNWVTKIVEKYENHW